MNKIMEKTKDLLISKQTTITKEAASMLTLASKVCTIEERISEFIKGINDTIINKARSSQFIVLVKTSKELLSKISIIQKDFFGGGFTIHTLAPEIKGVFIID